MSEKEAILAPSGISPWEHRIELTEEGTLCLWWATQHSASTHHHCRLFTKEETQNLLHFLEAWKGEIEAN